MIRFNASLILIVSSLLLQGQDIISVNFERTFTKLEGQVLSFAIGLQVNMQYDVDLYKVNYTTEGSDMRLDTASGLFMIPSGIDKAMPLACYQHGTTSGRSEVPSNFGAFYQMGVVLASNGMAVVAPDFLGMGSSRGFHPYVHAETEATAAVDLLRALETFLEEQELKTNGQLFIMGYSQGGHAAMALHKYIEESIPDEYQVTASLPMSGPYSVSGVMVDLAFGDEEFNFPSYIVYSSRGLREIYPDLYTDESELFKEEFLPEINKFVESGEGLTEMNLDLSSRLLTNYGEVLPSLMFKDSVLQELKTNPDNPFNLRVRENDVYDWKPDAPVLMLYCEGDDQVPFRNTIIADSVMNANGAENVSSMEVSGGVNRDHGQCAIPALNIGLPWLFSFQSTTPTFEIGKIEGIKYFPNPAYSNLNIRSEENLSEVLITDLAGKLYYQQSLNTQSIQVDVSEWSAGMYLLHLSSDDRTDIRKVIVQH